VVSFWTLTQNESPRGCSDGWLDGLLALSRVRQMNYGAMAMRYDEGVHVQPATCCFLRFDSFLCAAGQKLYADCSLPISGTKPNEIMTMRAVSLSVHRLEQN